MFVLKIPQEISNDCLSRLVCYKKFLAQLPLLIISVISVQPLTSCLSLKYLKSLLNDRPNHIWFLFSLFLSFQEHCHIYNLAKESGKQKGEPKHMCHCLFLFKKQHFSFSESKVGQVVTICRSYRRLLHSYCAIINFNGINLSSTALILQLFYHPHCLPKQRAQLPKLCRPFHLIK